jgi:hypothetical protein
MVPLLPFRLFASLVRVVLFQMALLVVLQIHLALPVGFQMALVTTALTLSLPSHAITTENT